MRVTNVRFVDTSILLYAISRDPAEEGKAMIANEIIDGGEIGLSVQVLQEFYVQATRATREDAIAHDQAAGLVESWCRFPVQVSSVEVMRAALATQSRFGISYWDAAIVEADEDAPASQTITKWLSRDTRKIENKINSGQWRRTDDDFALSWIKRYGKGRIFYSALGHQHDIFWNKTILQHYFDGIQFALGDLDATTGSSH